MTVPYNFILHLLSFANDDMEFPLNETNRLYIFSHLSMHNLPLLLFAPVLFILLYSRVTQYHPNVIFRFIRWLNTPADQTQPGLCSGDICLTV